MDREPIELITLAAEVASVMPWYVPVAIFLARLCDVSLGTLRSILVVSGHQLIPAVMGFVEVVIWVLAVGHAIRYLDHPTALLAYAGGYAMGVILGVLFEKRLALGFRLVRVISIDPSVDLAATLRAKGQRVTRVAGEGRDGPVEIDFIVLPRRDVDRFRGLVRELAPRAFVTVERVDHATGGGFASDAALGRRGIERFFPLIK